MNDTRFARTVLTPLVTVTPLLKSVRSAVFGPNYPSHIVNSALKPSPLILSKTHNAFGKLSGRLKDDENCSDNYIAISARLWLS
jgi:hypothetical protein